MGLGLRIESVVTEEDIFKYVIAREELTAMQSLKNVSTVISRIPSNIFKGTWGIFYEIVKTSDEYKIPLGDSQFQQLLNTNIGNFLNDPIVNVEINPDDEKLSDSELRSILQDTVLTMYNELEDLDVPMGYLDGNMELFIDNWAKDSIRRVIENQDRILNDGLRIDGKYYEGYTGARDYYVSASAFIDSIADKNADVLGDSINTLTETTEEISDKITEDTMQPVAQTGIEGFDKEIPSLNKGEIITLQAGSGVGKSVPNYTEIPTPEGFTSVGSIEVGDYVFDRLGKPTKVLGVYPQGRLDSYTVHLTDGRSFEASLDHLIPFYDENGKITDLPLRDILDTYKQKNYQIPVNEPVGKYHKTNKFIEEIDDFYKFAQNNCKDILNRNLPWFNEGSLNVKNREQLLNGLLNKLNVTINEDFSKIVLYERTELRFIKDLLHSLGYVTYVKYVDYIFSTDAKYVVTFRKEKSIGISYIIRNKDAEMTCLLVDNDEHLFLINDFIVTHNTRFGVNIAYQGMSRFKSNVLYISLEQKASAIYPMFLARHIAEENPMLPNMSDKDIRLKTYPSEYEYLVRDANEELVNGREEDKPEEYKYGRLYIEGRGVYEEELKNYLNSVWDNGFHFDILVLDYIGLVQSNGSKRFEAVANTINMLKDLVKNFKGVGFLGIVPNQIAKEDEKALLKGDTEASKLAGASSQDIVRASDIVLTLAETEEDKKNNQIELISSKIRLGNNIPKMIVDVDKGKLLFTQADLDDEEVEDNGGI